jgi:hypothetical protein
VNSFGRGFAAPDLGAVRANWIGKEWSWQLKQRWGPFFGGGNIENPESSGQNESLMARFPCAGPILLGLSALGSAPAEALQCPPTIPGAHVNFEQVGPAPTTAKRLDGLRLFDGPPGEEAKDAPAELAPDHSADRQGGFEAVWRFADNETLLMVCAYHGTKTYLRARPLPPPRFCIVQRVGEHTAAECKVANPR